MKPLIKKMIFLTLFSIAMGYLETAVVIYLRKIYYPNGFSFPLEPIEYSVAVTEFFRELATIIMLAGIGILAGRNTTQRIAFFIYCFAIWDLFYYVFLKIILNWPETFLTWDILFLIPVPWVGPVIAPCLVSLSMIVLTLFVVYFEEKNKVTQIKPREWLLLILGSLMVILSFVWDYFRFIRNSCSFKQIWTFSCEKPLFNEIAKYIPSEYNWWLFVAGELAIIYGIMTYVKRIKSI